MADDDSGSPPRGGGVREQDRFLPIARSEERRVGKECLL